MFQFIYWLKAIAAIFITNSHYADIWPVSAMAAGGHLGNCLFFLVSGFCLCQVKESLPVWYSKRILRIYPALWIAIVVNMVFGTFRVDSFIAVVHCFVYPTWFHFITSIMLLYLLFFLVRTLQEAFRIQTKLVLAVSVLIFAVMYLFLFDKTHYHIDDVMENWVRYQFWISMMIGACLREKIDTIRSKISALEWTALVVLVFIYFSAKIAVGRFPALYSVQILSPATLVLLVAHVAIIFIKLEKQGLLTQKSWLRTIVNLISTLTLEIYLIQNIIIHQFGTLPFPANFCVVSVLILAAAWIVHQAAEWIRRKCSRLLYRKGTQ